VTDETTTPTSDTTTPRPEATMTSDANNRAMISHLSALVMFLGIPSVFGPLVAWLAWRDDPYVGEQAKEALNFNISMLIYAAVAAVSLILLVGFVLLPALFIAWLVLVIDASVKASRGVGYRYPFTIRFVQ
jgi:uncharacterized protein